MRRAFYSDPEVGRFTSQDSFLGKPDNPPSLHRYLYAADRPTYYVDPTGHFNVVGSHAGSWWGEWVNFGANSVATLTEGLVLQPITLGGYGGVKRGFESGDINLRNPGQAAWRTYQNYLGGVGNTVTFGAMSGAADARAEGKGVLRSTGAAVTTAGDNFIAGVTSREERRVLADPNASVPEKIAAGSQLTANTILAVLGGKAMAEGAYGRFRGNAVAPTGVVGESGSVAPEQMALPDMQPLRPLRPVPAGGISGGSQGATEGPVQLALDFEGTATGRTPIPGDADFIGPVGSGSWRLVPRGQGAHLFERGNVSGRSNLELFDEAGTPRYYPEGTPEGAGQAHVRLHEATSAQGIERTGGNPQLTEGELIRRYGTAYSSPELEGIRGTLRTPRGNTIVGERLTPSQAWDALLDWFVGQRRQ